MIVFITLTTFFLKTNYNQSDKLVGITLQNLEAIAENESDSEKAYCRCRSNAGTKTKECVEGNAISARPSCGFVPCEFNQVMCR